MTCPRLNKWIGGCRFEARYEPAVSMNSLIRIGEFNASHEAINAIAKHVRGETYIGEACRRCGRVVKREGEK